MSVYKDNATGKWRVIYRYTDITGKRRVCQVKCVSSFLHLFPQLSAV